jgi:hypothetical protein
MHNICVQTVFSAGEILGKLSDFCALSTAAFVPRSNRVKFVRNLSTICTQARRSYTHNSLHFGSPYFLSVLHINHRPY